MARRNPILWFRQDHGAEQGFAAPAVSREDVNDEKVVRELVQNSLDSGPETGLRVVFRHETVPLEQIPLIDQYRGAFDRCETSRRGKEQAPVETTERIRIAEALSKRRIPVLVCADNGNGIGSEAIRSLYGTGATTKATQGRGSVGVGHLTAFPPSKLRYVLYGGRRIDTVGVATVAFGGHAILATAHAGSGPQRSQWAADGYVMPETDDSTQGTLFVSEAEGIPELPTMLRRWLPEESGSGSLVVICGYAPIDDKIEAGKALGDLIVTAVAKNFTVAIHDETLTVEYVHEGEQIAKLSRSELPACLTKVKDQLRNRNGAGPRGEIAYRVLETLRHGRNLTSERDGVSLWFRPLRADERTHVSVYRDGMWITGDCPRLGRADFNGYKPFDAVLDVKQTASAGRSSLAELIRKAEGASHLKVRINEIAESGDQDRLKYELKKLRDVLREEAGKSTDERWIPEHLRVLRGERKWAAKPITRPKTKIDQVIRADKEKTEETTDNSLEGDDPPEHGGKGSKSPKRRTAGPRKGNASGVRSSPAIVEGKRIVFAWHTEKSPAAVGIRVALPSGSDETDRDKAKPKWLAIAEVIHDNTGHRPDGDLYEVVLAHPPTEGHAEIELAEPVNPKDADVLIVDMVHRAGRTRTDMGAGHVDTKDADVAVRDADVDVVVDVDRVADVAVRDADVDRVVDSNS